MVNSPGERGCVERALENTVSPEAARRLDYVAAAAATRLMVRDREGGLSAGGSWGTGTRGMRERGTRIGGRLEIGNRRGGSGCEVRLEVPLEAQP